MVEECYGGEGVGDLAGYGIEDGEETERARGGVLVRWV